MKKLIACLLSFLLVLALSMPTSAEVSSFFVAVIKSPDLRGWFPIEKRADLDYFVEPKTWGELDKILSDIKEKSNGKQIYLDFAVHGAESGLCLSVDIPKTEKSRDSWATMGYVLNHIQKIFQGSRMILTFESCYAGRAYKYSIRGLRYKQKNERDYEEDYPNVVPGFPVYGSGDSFRVPGPIMYCQVQHDFRKWWVDLRDYDRLGKNQKLLPKEPYSKDRSEPTTLMMEVTLYIMDN